MAEKVVDERSNDSAFSQPGHISAIVAVVLLLFAVFVIVTVFPQSVEVHPSEDSVESKRVCWSATTCSSSEIGVPQAPVPSAVYQVASPPV